MTVSNKYYMYTLKNMYCTVLYYKWLTASGHCKHGIKSSASHGETQGESVMYGREYILNAYIQADIEEDDEVMGMTVEAYLKAYCEAQVRYGMIWPCIVCDCMVLLLRLL